MLTYQWEPLSLLLDNDGLQRLVEKHWREIALDQDDVPLVVDWQMYLRRERLGEWRAFTVRRDTRLAGYIAFFFHTPERYRSTLYITDDTIWIVPDETNRGIMWYLLVKNAIASLPRPSKLQIKIRLTKLDGRAGEILKKLGLRPIETVYSTYLR